MNRLPRTRSRTETVALESGRRPAMPQAMPVPGMYRKRPTIALVAGVVILLGCLVAGGAVAFLYGATFGEPVLTEGAVARSIDAHNRPTAAITEIRPGEVFYLTTYVLRGREGDTLSLTVSRPDGEQWAAGSRQLLFTQRTFSGFKAFSVVAPRDHAGTYRAIIRYNDGPPVQELFFTVR